MIREYISAVLDYVDILLRLAIVLVFGCIFIGAALLHNLVMYPFADFKEQI